MSICKHLSGKEVVEKERTPISGNRRVRIEQGRTGNEEFYFNLNQNLMTDQIHFFNRYLHIFKII